MTQAEIQFQIEFKKTISVIAYIINKLKRIREVDLIYLFKVLYFADKEHIKKYGRSILDDRYIAMANGPVPSFVYDLIKGIRGDGIKLDSYNSFYNSFTVNKQFYIDSSVEADMDFMSSSDIECIDNSIEKYGNWDSESLSDESHDEAWKKTFHSFDNTMKLEDVAKAAGADEKLIMYILEARQLKQTPLTVK